ncbi:unnamed protein product [Discosporangium mesarthrocarpum]
MDRMSQLVHKMMQRDGASIFSTPVSALEYPDYHKIVKQPMDLDTVQKKIAANEYDSPRACAKDIRLIWTNAFAYNQEDSVVAESAHALSKAFEGMYNKIVPDDFNCDREPTPEERHKFSRDIYRVVDAHLAEAVSILERKCPEAVVRVREI